LPAQELTQEATVAPAPLVIFTMAFACGAGAANLYYAQPLIGLIGPTLGLGLSTAGLIVTLTQIGYATGLFLLVPLGDLLENRRLIACTLGVVVLGLAAAALSTSAVMFLAASLLIGVSAVGVQMLVPFAASLAPVAMRGRVVGTVMSGLLVGILLARPASSLIAAALGWRAVFAASAVLMAAVTALLVLILPDRRPALGQSYRALIGSLWPLLRDTPVLQRRTLYQSALFGSFALFWTAAPLMLAGPPFHLTQVGIALFALAGAGGAFAAPIAGRLADAGWTRPGTGFSISLVGAAFALSWLGARGHGSIALLTIAAVLIDFGVQSNMVFGQRAIYTLAGQMRSRLNGIHIGVFFFGGALGSALAGPALAFDGWAIVTLIGLALPGLALLAFATEFDWSRRRIASPSNR
jgi:predicted MFS family arabinose efflux permease